MIPSSSISGEVYGNYLRLSPPLRYALRGMLYLASKSDRRYCLIEELAAENNLPKDFLAKIFQRLTHGGLLFSKRGRGGGYALARPAEHILLQDIVRCLEASNAADGQCFLEERACDPEQPCAIHESVVQAKEILQAALKRMSLADLKSDTSKTTA